MNNKLSQQVWGIRAGKGGKAHDLFLEEGVIALEDAGLGNLSKIEGTRDSFAAAYREIHPGDTRTGSAGIAGKYFRFSNEVEVGHLIVYPALPDKNVYVGEVTDEYEHVRSSGYPHQRAVKWKYVIPKNEFSQGAQYELGAARTFFQFKKHVDELLTRLAIKTATRFCAKAKAK